MSEKNLMILTSLPVIIWGVGAESSSMSMFLYLEEDEIGMMIFCIFIMLMGAVGLWAGLQAFISAALNEIDGE